MLMHQRTDNGEHWNTLILSQKIATCPSLILFISNFYSSDQRQCTEICFYTKTDRIEEATPKERHQARNAQKVVSTGNLGNNNNAHKMPQMLMPSGLKKLVYYCNGHHNQSSSCVYNILHRPCCLTHAMLPNTCHAWSLAVS